MELSIKTNSPEQNELIGLVQRGDRRSMSKLHKKYSHALLGIISTVIYRDEIAQEVLQDTFVKIWQKANSFNSQKGRLFTWMARIARNTAIDRLRSKNYKNGEKLDTFYQNNSLSNQNKFYMNLSDSGLMNTISKIDEKYENVLLAIYLHGYTQQQTSEKLNISLGTVKTRSRTGLKIMHQLLQTEKEFCI